MVTPLSHTQKSISHHSSLSEKVRKILDYVASRKPETSKLLHKNYTRKKLQTHIVLIITRLSCKKSQYIYRYGIQPLIRKDKLAVGLVVRSNQNDKFKTLVKVLKRFLQFYGFMDCDSHTNVNLLIILPMLFKN